MKILMSMVLLLAAPLALAAGQICSKTSPTHTVALLELYTSEGCSSCPPADRVVSGLKNAAAAGMVVPLSMHVDYWNYIGWTDRFSKAEFTQRQRSLADRVNSSVIYTPEMFLTGKELRGWRGDLQGTIAETNKLPARANIGIKLGAAEGGKLPVEISVKAAPGAKLFMALYENGLSSQVKAGENNGVTLNHDFVVRGWAGPLELKMDGSTGSTVLARALSIPSDSHIRQLGVAAIVQDEKGEVLQALALPYCEF